MKYLSFKMVVFIFFFLGSLFFGFASIKTEGPLKTILWMVAALAWASCIRNEYRAKNKNKF